MHLIYFYNISRGKNDVRKSNIQNCIVNYQHRGTYGFNELANGLKYIIKIEELIHQNK